MVDRGSHVIFVDRRSPQELQCWVLVSTQAGKTPTAPNSQPRCGRRYMKDAGHGKMEEAQVCEAKGVRCWWGLWLGWARKTPPQSDACIQRYRFQSSSICEVFLSSQRQCDYQTIASQLGTRGFVRTSKRHLLSLWSHSAASLTTSCPLFKFEGPLIRKKTVHHEGLDRTSLYEDSGK